MYSNIYTVSSDWWQKHCVLPHWHSDNSHIPSEHHKKKKDQTPKAMPTNSKSQSNIFKTKHAYFIDSEPGSTQ